MAKIKVMDEILANKIAAGEVVERCASVVKELVENSIDAGSTEIKVELKESGTKESKVTDDGCGMVEEDAILSFSRHATSKITSEDDLYRIDTLGFRGEALASIASVSEIELKTSTGDAGTIININGGKIESISRGDSRKGTIISVKNLFYNTPARLKYLKSEQYELANCVSFVEKLALSHPEIAFSLTNDNTTLVMTSGSNNMLKTIHEIYGLSVSKRMLEVRASNDDFDLFGYVCKPEILKSNRNHMIVIVNDRIVRNNDINRAINDAYYTYKPDIKYPIVVLKINTDPTLVDVNIHPTKQDIKLSKMDVLYDLIVKTIKSALYKALLIPDAIERLPESNPIKDEVITDIIKENDSEYKVENTQATFDFAASASEETQEEVININPEMKKLKLYPVGLAHGTYIIAENETGVFLIDQHAAQERVNYERNMAALKSHTFHQTNLLFPITIELSGSEFLAVQKEIPHLNEIGFDIAPFGMNTIIIKAHPTWLRAGYEEESIRKIIDLIVSGVTSIDPVKFNESVAITLDCKMSIKANMRISHEAQEELLDELCACDNPYNCPHGRPTIIQFSIYDLERMFKRSMN